ncbi:zinc ribbon domain-containing protein [Paenibacillus sp. EKM208P]|nr:zinc ribbon domain-containing protein [Paenibacillus sp. EKM208P]
MKLCVNCDNPLEDKSLYCNKCGAKQESSGTSDDTHVGSVDNSVVKIKKTLSKKILFITAAICMLFIVSVVIYLNTPEQKARATVDNYLNALQHGESVSKFKKDYFTDYVNVLDFKYINTREHLSYDGKQTLTLDEDWYNKYEKQKFSSFIGFLIVKEAEYREKPDYTILESNSEKLVVRDNKVGHSFSFLYDMQVTNGLGTPVYKKVTFDVDNFSGEYKISYYFDK